MLKKMEEISSEGKTIRAMVLDIGPKRG